MDYPIYFRAERLTQREGIDVTTAALVAAIFLAAAPYEQHYSPRENLESFDVALIGTAAASIDMAAYVLTDKAVIGALEAAARRGVRIRVYLDPQPYEAATIKAMSALGVSVKIKPPGPLMHLKSYCVDGSALRMGAANFSVSGLRQQDNDLEIDRRAGACAAFERDFAIMWERQQ